MGNQKDEIRLRPWFTRVQCGSLSLGCFPVPFLSCSFPSWALSTPVSKPGFPRHDEIIKKFSVSDMNGSAHRECLFVWCGPFHFCRHRFSECFAFLLI